MAEALLATQRQAQLIEAQLQQMEARIQQMSQPTPVPQAAPATTSASYTPSYSTPTSLPPVVEQAPIAVVGHHSPYAVPVTNASLRWGGVQLFQKR